jgi:phage shock protein A
MVKEIAKIDVKPDDYETLIKEYREKKTKLKKAIADLRLQVKELKQTKPKK